MALWAIQIGLDGFFFVFVLFQGGWGMDLEGMGNNWDWGALYRVSKIAIGIIC